MKRKPLEAMRVRNFGLPGAARTVKSESIIKGQRGPDVRRGSILRKSQQGLNNTKGEKDEKTSLNCNGGDGITSCARPAFRRSDYGWRRRSRGRIWLSRVPIRLLSIWRLFWLLSTVSVLQLLLWAIILPVQRTPLLPSPPAQSPLLSLLT